MCSEANSPLTQKVNNFWKQLLFMTKCEIGFLERSCSYFIQINLLTATYIKPDKIVKKLPELKLFLGGIYWSNRNTWNHRACPHCLSTPAPSNCSILLISLPAPNLMNYNWKGKLRGDLGKPFICGNGSDELQFGHRGDGGWQDWKDATMTWSPRGFC